MTPGMRTDRMSGGRHLLEDLRLVGGVQADGEEDRLGAVRGERRQHCRGVFWPGSVVEGEHHLAVSQEIVGLELLEAETGPSRRVDLDHAGDAKRIGITR